MDTKTQNLMFSSKSDEWGTPQDFYNKLNRKFKFTLDACATHDNRKCQKYFTKSDDGLSKSWKGETVFVNPPYGDIKKWVKKSYDEYHGGETRVVMLIPARTDTRYWHDYIMESASEIYLVKGRLKFENGENKQNSAPFPSAVVVFGGLRWGPGPRVASMER